MNSINISEINSTGVRAFAAQYGIEKAERLSDNGKAGDESLILYRVGNSRVIVTNGDPVWEDSDSDAFDEILEAEGMKPARYDTSRLFDIAGQINAFAKEQGDLLPVHSVAFVCDRGGSIGETQDPDGMAYITLDFHRWPERARTYTQKGREEIAREESAVSKVHSFCEKFGALKHDGHGSGEFGEFTCFILVPRI